VAGEPQPQIDIHKAVSRLWFFFCFFLSSFDDTTTELGLDAQGLTVTVVHLNLGFICFVLFGFGVFFCFVFSPLVRQ
jgi:hypothetical protein